ncbi:tyrosine-protein phosphatase [Nocardia jiangxiensis]|uniref:Tyrosine-protein phosphatase n=1 Tax=Nocardia jiangxiensis TaxID=282685 RepID=A0ABW6SET0_9NOCA|nr:tyrosine-protein phosphatase [Nocardia jiangxiensis]
MSHETDTDTLANLRDVGGLRCIDGRTTKTGVLYRSDAPYMGDTNPLTVEQWPPTVVVDLRSLAEVDRNPFDWSSQTLRHHLPLHDGAAPTEEIPQDLAGLYGQILDSAPDRVASLVGIVAHADGPVLLHCAAGKDRTGVAVATLLLAADVEPAAVIGDYLLTASRMPALGRRWKAKATKSSHRRPLPAAWLTAPEAAIVSVVRRLGDRPGGAGGWLVDHGATRSDLDLWRNRLLT